MLCVLGDARKYVAGFARAMIDEKGFLHMARNYTHEGHDPNTYLDSTHSNQKEKARTHNIQLGVLRAEGG